MGDMLTLIERAESTVSEEKRRDMQKKLLENSFTLDDFREQLRQLKKMGSLEQIMQMIPGMGKMAKMKGMIPPDKDLVQVEAIINSMTSEERRRHGIINGSRRKRIARGSGTTVQDINRLLKNYTQVMKMVKKINKGGLRGLGRGMMPF